MGLPVNFSKNRNDFGARPELRWITMRVVPLNSSLEARAKNIFHLHNVDL